MFNNIAFIDNTMQPMQQSMVFLYKVASEKRQVHAPSAVGRVMGVSQQRLKNWEARGISKEGALIAQALFGIDSNDLLALNSAPDAPPMAYGTRVEPFAAVIKIEEKRADRASTAWPFKTVSPEQWEELTQKQKSAVEAVAGSYVITGDSTPHKAQPANNAAAA